VNSAIAAAKSAALTPGGVLILIGAPLCPESQYTREAIPVELPP
jgi:hypothetical protein